MAYMIHGGRGERYSVDDSGNIGRPQINLPAGGKWKALALVRRNNFGVIEVIPFSEWTAERLASLQWTFKNGKPRYTLRDMDHGTMREWGEMVRSVTSG